MKAPDQDWDALERTLQEFAGSGTADVCEDGEWLAELDSFQCELRHDRKNPVVRLWSVNRNLTRRVLRIREQSASRLVLDVQKFGRAKAAKLEFVRKDVPRTENRINRGQFRARFARFLAERFPDSIVDSLAVSTDKENTFSELYVRGWMHEGSIAWALLAASESETAATVEGMLAYGLLWLDWTRNHSSTRAVNGLRLFVPEGGSRLLRERLLALSPIGHVEIFEMAKLNGELRRIDIADAGNLESWLTPRRDIDELLRRANEAIGSVRIAWPENAGKIELRVASGAREVAYCCRGLEFARWTREGIVIGESPKPLTERTQPTLDRAIRQLALHRSPLADDTNHPLYRTAAERWLESIILENPAELDAMLDPKYFYSQVPALAAGDRGVIDLLGITRQGRLVVTELKASAEIQLPLQAVDYWLRVRRHQLNGDFQRDGYFVGAEIDPRPPLVWLVAPALQFHSSAEVLLKYLSPEIHVTRIGLNEKWRRGVKILFRQ